MRYLFVIWNHRCGSWRFSLLVPHSFGQWYSLGSTLVRWANWSDSLRVPNAPCGRDMGSFNVSIISDYHGQGPNERCNEYVIDWWIIWKMHEPVKERKKDDENERMREWVWEWVSDQRNEWMGERKWEWMILCSNWNRWMHRLMFGGLMWLLLIMCDECVCLFVLVFVCLCVWLRIRWIVWAEWRSGSVLGP